MCKLFEQINVTGLAPHRLADWVLLVHPRKQSDRDFCKQAGYHHRCNCASQDLSCLQAHEFLNGKYLPPTKWPPVLLDVLLGACLPFST